MCNMLQAYCLVSKGVRLICTNQTPKGYKSVLMSTHGSKDILLNIQAIFGAKQMSEIIPLKSPFNVEGELTKENLLVDLNEPDANVELTSEELDFLNRNKFQLEGFISSCSHGSGRSSKDRQFFYVNSRPCDPKNASSITY